MPENYDFEDVEPQEDNAGAMTEAPGEGAGESEDEATEILPKSILGGEEYEPGDVIQLRIVRMHDDVVEVARDTSGPAEEGEEEPEAMAAGGPPRGPDEIGEMMG